MKDDIWVAKNTATYVFLKLFKGSFDPRDFESTDSATDKIEKAFIKRFGYSRGWKLIRSIKEEAGIS